VRNLGESMNNKNKNKTIGELIHKDVVDRLSRTLLSEISEDYYHDVFYDLTEKLNSYSHEMPTFELNDNLVNAMSEFIMKQHTKRINYE